jgi:hypothetical protein
MALVGNMTYHRRASSPGMALLGNMAYQMRPSLCGMALLGNMTYHRRAALPLAHCHAPFLKAHRLGSGDRRYSMTVILL